MNNNKLIFFVSAALAALSASINQFTFVWAASRFGVGVLGASLLAAMLPQLLLMSFSGIMADRLEPTRLLSISAVLRAAVLLIMIFVFSLQPSGFVFIAGSFVLSVIGYIFGGSNILLIPMLFNEAELVNANARVSLVSDLAYVVGPILAAWVYATSGVKLALFVDATLLAVSGFLILLLPKLKRAGAAEPLDLKFALAGFKYLRESPKVFRIVIFFAITNVFMAALQVSLPIYAEQIGGVGSFAALSSSMNIAAMLSNLVLASISLASSEAVIYSTSMVKGLAIFALASVRTLPRAMLFSAVNDAMANINSTLFVAWLQKMVSNEVLGRVYSAIGTVAMLLTPIAFAITPSLINIHGVVTVLYSLGILTFVISLGYLIVVKLDYSE